MGEGREVPFSPISSGRRLLILLWPPHNSCRSRCVATPDRPRDGACVKIGSKGGRPRGSFERYPNRFNKEERK